MFYSLISAALLSAAAGHQPAANDGSAPQRRGISSNYGGQQTRPAKRVRRAEAGPRMAGSPTGYVDDAVVSSKIRVRFDAGFGIDRPDRAEFFYGKCGCYRVFGLDANAPGPGPQIISKLNYQELYINVEYAPFKRFSLIGEVPLRSVQAKTVILDSHPAPASAAGMGGTDIGLSDVRAGLKFALLASPRHYLTAQVRTYAPTGSALAGLGTNHVSVEPSLIYYQKVGNRASYSAQLGGWIPVDSSSGLPLPEPKHFSGDVVIYGGGVSYETIRQPRFRLTPVLELVGWSVRDGLQTSPNGPASAITNIVNVKIGGRFSFGEGGSSVYAGYGRVLTDQRWYGNIFRLEYRYSF